MLKNSSLFSLVCNLAAGLTLGVSVAVGSDVSNAPTGVTVATSPVAPYPSNSRLLPGKGPMQTWKPFREYWMQRRTEFQQQRKEDSGAIVFLGDSITQGWNDLAKAFPDFKVANRGIAGDTTRGVLYRLNEDVIDLKPEAVVLLIGTNDLGLGAKPEDVADNIQGIIRALEKANPRMPIIFCEIMPSNGTEWNRPATTIEKVNALVLKAIKGDPHVSVCDTWSIFADQNGNCSASEFPDLLHPNSDGYALWAKVLQPILKRLGLAANHPG